MLSWEVEYREARDKVALALAGVSCQAAARGVVSSMGWVQRVMTEVGVAGGVAEGKEAAGR